MGPVVIDWTAMAISSITTGPILVLV